MLTWAKPLFHGQETIPPLSLDKCHILLTESPPSQKLIWTPVSPFTSLSKLPGLFLLQHFYRWLLSLSLFYMLPQDPSGLCPYFTAACQRAFLKNTDRRKTFSRLLPCPHRVTTFSVGGSGSTRVIHSPVLNITSSTGEECQLFTSYPEITLSPSFSPPLSQFSQNLNMVIKFRESKWQWKKKSRPHLPSGLAHLWEMPFALCISSYPVDRMLPGFWRGIQSLSCTAAFNKRRVCFSNPRGCETQTLPGAALWFWHLWPSVLYLDPCEQSLNWEVFNLLLMMMIYNTLLGLIFRYLMYTCGNLVTRLSFIAQNVNLRLGIQSTHVVGLKTSVYISLYPETWIINRLLQII